MTTESKQDTRRHRVGVSPLLGAAAACAALVVVTGLVALALAGPAGLQGALAGGLLALVVFLLGTTVVNAVARLMPAMSLLVAMLTYALQVIVMALVVLALVQSDLGGEPVFREWFAGAVIAVTMLWLAVQVWLFTRLRILAFDGSGQGQPGGES